MQGAKAGSQLTMYVSTEGHSCLDKSVDMLGIGREHLRKIPVGPDFRIDLEKLEQKILEDQSKGFLPICIIGNGGTVNTGAIDPLNDLAALAKRYHLWFHIDAAYGGPAASTSLAASMFSGIEKADSVATDGHKWLYVPYEVGIALVKNKKVLSNAFRIVPDYLRSDPSSSDRHNPTEFHFELSRSFKALKTWMTFLAYGAPALRKAIESNIETMWFLAKLIDSSDDFERMAPVPLSIVCFRYKTADPQFWDDEEYLSLLNQKILADVENDGRVFLSGTILNGKQVLRACSVNHRTDLQHVQFLLNVLREIGANAHLARPSVGRERVGVRVG
jgi:glutamate/tyrosine decarboxylase-like PLP-dependent enzyme